MIRRGTIVALVACGAALAGCAGERALVTRAPLGDDKVGFGFYSHTSGVGAARNHKHWDNFTLSRDALVTGVRFWGLSDGAASPGLENFASFAVEIWSAGADGAPGERLAWASAARDRMTIRATGRFGIGGPEGAGTGAEHEFTLRFNEPAALAKDTTYFLSVMAERIDGASDNFMWADGQRGDGVSYSWSHDRAQMLRWDDTDSALVILGRAQ